MGGFWAYETLGWGGFWMWDPVENVSFVPWCFVLALVHGIIVQATRKKWQMPNLMMGALPFLVFLYGTFLTRSGLLSDASVHSFAEMDRSALKLLITLMGGATFGFLGLWAVRLFQAKKVAPVQEAVTPGLKRESFYVIGITTLLLMGVATMIGMSVPLVQALKGEKPRVVEEALYHQVLPWIFIPLMVLMAVTPFVSWREMKPKELAAKVYTVFCITVGLTGLVLFLAVTTPVGKDLNLSSTVTMLGRWSIRGLPWLTALAGICIFVLVANFIRVIELFKRSKMGTAPFFAHIGVAVLMAGLIISRGFEQKAQAIVMQDRPARLMSYEVRYAGMTSNEDDRENKLKLDIYNPHKKGGPLFTATPGLYKVKMADGQVSTMVWPYIHRGWLMDTYVSLGQPQTDASEDISLVPGASTQFGNLMLTYVKMTRKGEFGQAGTRFGAEVKVSAGGGSKTINPEMEIVPGGETIMHPAKLGENMELVMAGMNAADKSAMLRIRFLNPIYPIEIYHKPMTGLVWLGTGIMTLAGFASAFYRRSPKKVAAAEQVVPKAKKRAADLVTAIKGEST
jgi:cytochrome c-type biogenesis protein CcmF